MGSPPRQDISPEALDRVRHAAEEMLRERFDGSPRSMRVILTTYGIEKTAMEGPQREPELHPLWNQPVYIVVLEGDFRLRPPPHRTGGWLAIAVTPSFVARSFRGPAPRGGPGDRLINLDLNQLGRVYEITDL